MELRVLEAALIAWAMVGSWLIWRRGVLASVLVALASAGAAAISVGGLLIAAPTLPSLSNPVVGLLALFALMVGGYLLLRRFLLHLFVAGPHSLLRRRGQEHRRLPGWLRAGLLSVFSLLRITVCALIAFALVNAYAMSGTRHRDRVITHALLAQHLLVTGTGNENATGSDKPTVTGQLAPAPERSHRWRMPGALGLAPQIRALYQVLELDPELQARLVAEDDELLGLLSHPAMQDAARDERIAELVEQALRGSLSAVYQLGELSSVQQLLYDRELHRRFERIDVIALGERAQALQREREPSAR
jgi:hypothetical protein